MPNHRSLIRRSLIGFIGLIVLISCKTIQQAQNQISLPTETVEPGSGQPNTPAPTDEDESAGGLSQWMQATVTPGVGISGRFQPLGQIGGNTYAVAVSGRYAYFGSGPRLLVADLQDQSEMKLVGQSEPLPGVVRGVAVREPYLYVAAGKGNLRVLDISDPLNPHEVGALEAFQWAMAVVIDGDRLYIADNAQGLWIADISNPTVPEVLGTVQLKTPAAAVAVKDDTACVVSMHGLLVLIDVSDPANPTQVGELALPQMSAGVALKDQFALVAAGMEGLWVVDVSDPAALKKVASQPAIFADGIVVEGGLAYLTASMEGLITFDVSDPADPKRLGAVPLTIFSQGVPGQRQLAVQNGRVILANQNQGLLQVDASNPQAPALVGALDAPLSGSAFDTAVSSGTAYVTRDFIGLGSVQVSDPANPIYGNSETSFVKGAPVRTSWKLAVQGGYSYLTDVNMGFRVVDLVSFAQVGGLKEPRKWSSVILQGSLAYATTTEHDPKDGDPEARRSLRVIDISDPRAPVQVGLLKMENNSQAIALDGDTLFYADMLEIKQEAEGEFSAFHVIDVSNPTAPVQVGEVDTTGQCQVAFAIVVKGDYAFIGDQKTGLCVIDIKDRTDPRIVLNWQEMPSFYDLALVGERIFAANYSHISAINISDPLHPVLEDLTITPGLSWGIDAVGEQVYIADMDGGLNILGYR